eukprot:7267032-Pyramimonas_sp.AAC.1
MRGVRRKQLCVIAEVLRVEARDAMRSAASISLSLPGRVEQPQDREISRWCACPSWRGARRRSEHRGPRSLPRRRARHPQLQEEPRSRVRGGSRRDGREAARQFLGEVMRAIAEGQKESSASGAR